MFIVGHKYPVTCNITTRKDGSALNQGSSLVIAMRNTPG